MPDDLLNSKPTVKLPNKLTRVALVRLLGTLVLDVLAVIRGNERAVPLLIFALTFAFVCIAAVWGGRLEIAAGLVLAALRYIPRGPTDLRPG